MKDKVVTGEKLERIKSVYGTMSDEKAIEVGALSDKVGRAAIVCAIAGILLIVDSFFIKDPLPVIDEAILALTTVISGGAIASYDKKIKEVIKK